MMELFRFTDQNMWQIMNCPLLVNILYDQIQVTMYSFVLFTLQVKIYTRWWIVLCACSVHAHGSVHATTSLPDTVTRIGRWNVALLRLCSCVHCSEVVVQLISSKGLHNRSKRKSYKQIMDSCKSICTFKWIFIYDSTVDFS